VKHLEGTRGTVKVDYDPNQLTVDQIVRATELSNHNYRVAVGDPKDVPVPSEEIDCRIIASGMKFRIEENLAKGKLTIVDFYVEDRPCREVDAWLATLSKKHGFARRRVNVDTPDSPASRQLKELFGVEKVPYARLYGKDGAFVKEFRTPSRDEVEAAVKP
jgi:hypothetical protein